MPCSWIYLASRTTAERFCGKPGHPYCPEHQREIDAMAQGDKDWDEIMVTHEAVCEEPKDEQKLCAVCDRRPIHTDCPVRTDCVCCEMCCADGSAGNLRTAGVERNSYQPRARNDIAPKDSISLTGMPETARRPAALLLQVVALSAKRR